MQLTSVGTSMSTFMRSPSFVHFQRGGGKSSSVAVSRVAACVEPLSSNSCIIGALEPVPSVVVKLCFKFDFGFCALFSSVDTFDSVINSCTRGFGFLLELATGAWVGSRSALGISTERGSSFPFDAIFGVPICRDSCIFAFASTCSSANSSVD